MFFGSSALLAADGNRIICTIPAGPNHSMKIFDFINGDWELHSKIDGVYCHAGASNDGEVIVVGSCSGPTVRVFEYINEAWQSTVLESPDYIKKYNWWHLDSYMNQTGNVFTLSYYRGNPSGPKTSAVSIYKRKNKESDWVHKRVKLPAPSEDNYLIIDSEISASGDTIYITDYSRLGTFPTSVLIFEDQPVGKISAFLDIDCDGLKNNLEPFVNNSMFVINDSVSYASGNVLINEVPVNIGLNTVTFQHKNFISSNENYEITGDFFDVDEISIPVKYKDSTVVDCILQSWGDTYVCNESANVNVEVLNLSIAPYDFELELKFEGLDPPHHDTLLEIQTKENLQPLEYYNFVFSLEMPDESFTGELMDIKATLNIVDPMTQELVKTEALDLSNVLRCSYDPNDKAVFPRGVGNSNFTLFGQPLHYRIRFQNTGNYLATDVVVKDQLDEDLDWSTFRLINASHEITSINMDQGLVTFDFTDIFLPDSTSNEPLSHGFINFSIFPKENLPEKTVIGNFAQIFFDFNAPIKTNKTLNTLVSELPGDAVSSIDLNAKSISIYPNPTEDLMYFTSDYEIEKIEVYDIQGQFVSTVLYNSDLNVIDLSGIEEVGAYFLKMYMEKGFHTLKFIKSK